MEGLITFLVLMTLGYCAGSYAEKRHYGSIRKREEIYLGMPAVTIKNAVDTDREIAESGLVSGSVVVSLDYFKRFLASLRNIFGGRVKSFETLVDRGRREAILRMKGQMPDADIILNMRIETSVIGRSANRKNSLGSIEVMAYGTAVKYRKKDEIHTQTS